ncbi:hypothetical protein DdX_03884 [Ditylenchus destructor]|uniref:Uncharacterized protein n=1 Tax=Ditylenchus destructor TaxID=166010 RepID=A0AAD4R588_9BILA|nr:hypothetical protein DdX_03884 [Ditylenchus destructor]
MKFVVKLCENHLMKKSKLSVKTKIEASDMFHLPNVMRKCLSGVRSAEPLLSLIEDRDFMCGLSKETQNKIRQEIVGNWARRN